jgi:hypothetical protein
MSYLGKEPTPVPLTSQDIADGVISTVDLADGAVTNAKVDANAAIDISKIAGLDTYTGELGGSNLTLTGYLRGPSNFTIDPAAHGDNTGTLIIAGNLQVDGTTTTINSATMTVDDLNIVVASGAADASAADGAGLTIDGASISLTYDHSNTRMALNSDLNITGTLSSTSLSASNLTVGALTYPSTDGSDGQVLTTDGAGNVAFETLEAGVSTGKAIAMAIVFGG